MKDKVFSCAKWIWHGEEAIKDDRAEFYGSFVYRGEKAVCRISCDSDYALYINGKFVESNQYGDFPHYKIYDEIDISPYLVRGENSVGVCVWYFGEGSQKYYPSAAGAIFEIEADGNLLLKSDGNILARRSKAYACGRAKRISSQLGMSFCYDLNLEDGWKTGDAQGFSPAREVQKDCVFYARPNEKLRRGKTVEPRSVEVRHEGRTVIVDLGKETVGLAYLKFYSPVRQRITLCFGEKLSCRNVMRFIGGNDYSFEIEARAGENEFFDPFLRLGCRYLQLCADRAVEVEKLSLIPVYYPVKENRKPALCKQDREIFGLCKDTLKLCMLEHFVDCPFREQGLYTFDSRNQMLAGYYAFGGSDYFKYAKSNLKLFARDKRADKLLTITAPSDTALCIPSYSLHYAIAVAEYLEHSGERELDREIIDKIAEVISVFSRRIENGLVKNFTGEGYWNFYDWSPASDRIVADFDLLCNALYLLSVKAYLKICDIIGEKPISGLKEREVAVSAREAFFDKEKGLFFNSEKNKVYTQLGNSLAVLAGIADKSAATSIMKKALSGEAEKCSLATKTFLYDALLAVDKENGEIVLKDIRECYGHMLACGATATWETLDGENAFGGDGSLCHGWSAIPIYYLNILSCTRLQND